MAKLIQNIFPAVRLRPSNSTGWWPTTAEDNWLQHRDDALPGASNSSRSLFLRQWFTRLTRPDLFYHIIGKYSKYIQISNINQIWCVFIKFICHGFPVCLPDHSNWIGAPTVPFPGSSRIFQDLPGFPPWQWGTADPRAAVPGMVNSENCWKLMKIAHW